MAVNQLSAFLENREGRLEEVFDHLADAGINVVSASVADTKDYGILRTIVTDSEKAQKVLKEHGISSKVIPVLAINISHSVGSLDKVLHAIADANQNIAYMYGLSVGDKGASIAIKTSDIAATEAALQGMKDVQIFDDASIAEYME